MKLYSEDQVKKMLEVCRDSDLYEHILTFEHILKTETPIELPSEFVPYEEALALKELGFDEPCLSYWDDDKVFELNPEFLKGSEMDSTWLATPTFSQAFRWFREKYNFLHLISWVYKKTEGIQWFFVIKGINMTNNNILPDSEIRFETYEEAELACLNKLIEIAKQGLLPLSK